MNVFEIGAKIGLDSKSFINGLSSASGAVKSFASKTKDVLGGVAKAATATLGAASAGIVAFSKQAVSAYADYEQLVGGVETLFGEAAKTIKENADKAFKTAGLSVNEYMETSIQSAAALINSLGGDTEKAAELMDMSIIDMSDNVNKMGTNMESIQNAYRGFSRGNFTMLDNLALGFAGTKEGMEELLEKAKELSGVEYDISSYSDIVQAIHVVQTEMGITGTTAKEAATTISGSISSMKSAWKNLVIEIGKDDGNVANSFDNLQKSIVTVSQNVMPRVEEVLDGISTLITTSAPRITKAITNVLPKILPKVISAAGKFLSGIGTTIVEALPDLIETGRNLMANLTYGMVTSDVDGQGILGKLLDSVVSNAPYYFQYAQMIVSFLADKLLNVDYGRIGGAIHDIIVSGINSLTDFVKGVDFTKVGTDIAEFLNGINFTDIAQHIFDLIAEGIKKLPDLAESFFSKADIGNLMAAIGLLGAPKLIGSLTTFMKGSEGQALGNEAGKSWSGAFMAGIEAFGLGYAIGTWLRDNITIGDKTLGEWVDQGTEKALDKVKDSKILNSKLGSLTDIGRTVQAYNKAQAELDVSDRLVTAKLPDGTYGEIVGKNKDGSLNSAGRKYGVGVNWEGDWKNADHNAIGNYIKKPTLTWAAENEPEYIIPESKMGSVFPRNGGNTFNFTVNIDGTGKNAEEIADEAIEVISTKLDILGIQQQRGVGGKSWA